MTVGKIFAKYAATVVKHFNNSSILKITYIKQQRRRTDWNGGYISQKNS